MPAAQTVQLVHQTSYAAGEWQLRVDLAAAYRACYNYGFSEGVCNHLTALLPGTSDTFLVIPYGLLWCEVTAGNLLTVQATQDGQAKVLRGQGRVEDTAFFIHACIHKAAPHAVIVFHTHMPNTTALTCLQDPTLPMSHQNALRFYEDIAYDDYRGLVTDDSEGDKLAAAIGNKHILLHANHGVIVCEKTVWQAFDSLYYLERASEVLVKARSMGEPLKPVPPHVCADFKAGQDATGEELAWQFFQALKRELRRGQHGGGFEDADDSLPDDCIPGKPRAQPVAGPGMKGSRAPALPPC